MTEIVKEKHLQDWPWERLRSCFHIPHDSLGKWHVMFIPDSCWLTVWVSLRHKSMRREVAEIAAATAERIYADVRHEVIYLNMEGF